MPTHRPAIISTFAALAASTLLSACGAASAGTRAAVRDSAGITIVENHGRLRPDVSGWAVAPEPFLSIGTLEGEWTDQLYGVREAMRLPDGRIAIGNAGTEEIRIYGPDGSFLNVFGGDGEGPGEFQGLSLVGILPGDTLVAVGRRDHRISLVHPESGFIRSVTPEGLPEGPFSAYGLFADGRMVVQAGFHFNTEQMSSGPTRQLVTYYSAQMDGSELVAYPALQGSELWMNMGEDFVSIMQVPFGKRPAVAVTSNRLYLGSGDSYEILAYTPDGALERIIRLDQEPVVLSQNLIDRYIEGEVAEAEDMDEAREIRSAYNDIPFPETIASYQSFRTDPLECLWVEEGQLPGDNVPVWSIFDAEGVLQARVSLPEGVDLLEAGVDYILGLVRGEFDVEYVQMFRLERPTG